MSTVEIRHHVPGSKATEVSISRDVDHWAVEEALELFLTTLGTENRHMVLGTLCRKFGHYEER